MLSINHPLIERWDDFLGSENTTNGINLRFRFEMVQCVAQLVQKLSSVLEMR